MGKVIVDLVTKYLVHKGLDFDCSIHGKVVAKGDDLIVHVSTPSGNNSGNNNSSSSSSVSTKSNKGKTPPPNANHNKNNNMGMAMNTMCVNIHLHYALLDLWEDSQIIEKSIHKALEIPVKTDRAQSNLPVK